MDWDAGHMQADNRNRLSLDSHWRLQHFRQGEMNPLEVAAANLDDRYWLSTTVPGDIHSTLIQHRLIPDPYFGHQDQLSRWVEQEEWWYRTTFDYELTTDRRERHELVFEGLDTFATVYVNGHEIGQAVNMHRRYAFDVSRLLRNGWNSIAVRFDPLHDHHRHKEKFDWSSYTKERPWIRKAAMNFGWDWGPRIITAGIWGEVYIQRQRIARLQDVYVHTADVTEKQAVVDIQAICEMVRPLRYTSFNEQRMSSSASKDTETTFSSTQPNATTAYGHAHGEEETLRWTVTLYDRDHQQIAREEVMIAQQEPSARRQKAYELPLHLQLCVPSPQLWWTHDLGDPYLYELDMRLSTQDGQELDRHIQQIGIRTLELQLDDGQGQPLFAFVLNGVRLYAKGTNWIPADNLIGAIPAQRYGDLLELSVQAHMNMMRVWAGGIYEKDMFYDYCDRLGILVWQDFAFANALFPDFNHDFMNNVQAEVQDNVCRLRNRPSLALWCGNNEIDWLYDMKTAGGDIQSPFYGEVIYHEWIPDILEQLDPHRPYWPSSPYGGNDVNDPNVGDRHNWQVWHGSVYPRSYGEAPLLDYSIEGVSFAHYKQDMALFSSEFGMHAAANPYTLSRYVPEDEYYWGNQEMAYRNKDTNHRKGILLMEGYTGIPQNMEQYIRYSMLTQAEGLKYGIEHYRRHKHRNSGSLIWQLNDSWPGTSWSIIDYELLPKAAYYYAKRFYHPLLLSLDHEPGQPLHIWAVNDTLSALDMTVTLDVMTWKGEVVYSQSFQANMPANEALQLGSVSEEQILHPSDGSSGVSANEVIVILTSNHPNVPDNRYYLRAPKELQLPTVMVSVHTDAEQGQVVIDNGDDIARMVTVELQQGGLRWSDNYFDLLPGERKIVRIEHPHGKPILWDTLKVSGWNVEYPED